MRARTPVDRALENKHLFIVHLAERLESMEIGTTPLKAVAYRVYAKRLHEAMAGFPEGPLSAKLAGLFPSIGETLAVRHFGQHGEMPGDEGRHARVVTDHLLLRMRGKVS
jgi:hypothetical protein